MRDWADAPLPAPVQARIARAEARLALVAEQLAAIDAQPAPATVRRPRPTSALARLVQLKGVATTSASVLLDEGLVWRAFQNRRQIGGLLGFAPAKYDSGESSRDQGISRAGNKRLQSVMVQLAWGWVHWQPHSALTRWYRDALWPRQTRAQDRDRGPRAQTADRALAVCDRRRAAGRRGAENGVGRRRARRTRAARTVRGGSAAGDRHGEGTAALVFGLRLDGLRGPRLARELG